MYPWNLGQTHSLLQSRLQNRPITKELNAKDYISGSEKMLPLKTFAVWQEV